MITFGDTKSLAIARAWPRLKTPLLSWLALIIQNTGRRTMSYSKFKEAQQRLAELSGDESWANMDATSTAIRATELLAIVYAGKAIEIKISEELNKNVR
jgi:hypothetical protein